MSSAFFSFDVLRTQIHPPKAPRGTSSRVLKLRLDRAFGPGRRWQSGPSTRTTNSPKESFDVGLRAKNGGLSTHNTRVGEQELQVLRGLEMPRPTRQTTPPSTKPIQPRAMTVQTSHSQGRTIRNHTGKGLEQKERQAFRGTFASYTHLRKLLSASQSDWKRRKDSWLNPFVELPPSTFSELLRSLDPMAAQAVLDPAGGTRFAPGATQMTSLGRSVNNWGIRVTSVLMLKRLLAAAELRIEGNQGLLMSDYKILLRCAGAAADPIIAKRIWHLMESRGDHGMREADAYSEFVKARFLTDQLSSQTELARYRVQPLNLHKAKIWQGPAHRRTLLALRSRIASLRFRRDGQNFREAERYEHMTRILRKPKPIMKIYSKMVALHEADEKFLSAAMIAFARTGSLRVINQILSHHWSISVIKDKTTGEVRVEGGTTRYSPDSPMYPTPRLLEAVVHSFACNAEIAMAVKTMDFISQSYNVPIPEKLWFDLLEWTYVTASRPVSTEWKKAGWEGKVLRPDAVQLVWDTMVSEPYQVRPGFSEYSLLIKALLAQNRLLEAMKRMLEAKPMYEELVREHERLFFEAAHCVRRGVDASEAKVRWLQAQARKGKAWYDMQMWCWSLFKRIQKSSSKLTLALVPNLVQAFRPFLPQNVKYRIPTGIVTIHDAAPVQRFVLKTHAFDAPDKLEDLLRGKSIPTRATQETDVESSIAEGLPVAGQLSRIPTRVVRVRRLMYKLKRPIRWEADWEAIERQAMSRATLQREFL